MNPTILKQKLCAALAMRDVRVDGAPGLRGLADALLRDCGVDPDAHRLSDGRVVADHEVDFVADFALAVYDTRRDQAAYEQARADGVDDAPTALDLNRARLALVWRADMSDEAREELARRNAREAAWKRRFAAQQRRAAPAPISRIDDRERDRRRAEYRDQGRAPLPNRVAQDKRRDDERRRGGR